MTESYDVDTPEGAARVWVDEAAQPRMRLVLGHGAGGGVGSRDLAAVAGALPAHGVSVLRVEQPWRLAGKRLAPRPAVLDRAWSSVLAGVPRDVPLVVGGRSAGARVSCRTAVPLAAAAVVALSFPLHPPGKPERTRVDELMESVEAGVPVLVVQGARDTFGRPEEFPDSVQIVAVPGADHGMAVTKDVDGEEALDGLVAAVREFLDALHG